MILDNLPFPVFGDPSYRGKCPLEKVEQASFFNRLRREYPDTWGRLALHPRNEGLLEKGQFSTLIQHKAEGMTAGAVDIIIPSGRAFVAEMKRLDHTKSAWQPGQVEYLTAASKAGAFACVALGALGAWEAFEVWLAQHN
jgi:hypothetical protein